MAAEAPELTPREATTESVAAQGWPFWTAWVNTLPPWSDDLERDFGTDIYERMLFDPQVSSSLGILVKGVLEDGIQITAAVKEGEDGHDQAGEIADFCRWNLQRLCPDLLTSVLPDLIEAYGLGHRVAEQVYEDAGDGPYAGKLVLCALKPRPRWSLSFVVDAYMNVLGLLNRSYPRLAILPEGDRDLLLPRRKFAVLTWGMKDCNPMGRSAFRCIYDAWWRKYQIIGEWLKYLVQFGSGSVLAVLGPDAKQTFEINPETGALLYETDGTTPKVRDPAKLALIALQALRGGSAAAFPNGTTITKLEMDGEGEAFVTALDRCDREIERGILHQNLATSEGQHQTRASSQVHQDTKGTVVRFVRLAVAQMLRSDVLLPLIEYNYGRAALSLLPEVSLGDTEQQDVAAMLTALGKVGFELHPTQFQQIDAQTGLPRRSDEAVADAVEAKKAPPPGAAGDPKPPDPEDDTTDEG